VRLEERQETKHLDFNNHYNKPSMKHIRRNLRVEPTAAEKVLWQHLRNRQIEGVKFRRQYSVDRYVIDFYAPELKLAIELDGSIHSLHEQQVYDYERQDHLELYGIAFLRFRNEVVLNLLSQVLEKITENIHRLRDSN